MNAPRFLVRVVLLIVLAALLVTGGAVLAQPNTGDVSSAASVPHFAVSPGQVSGGHYQLTGLAWQVGGVARGKGFSLSVQSPTQNGSGCCCQYLPCTLRGYH